MNSDKYVKADKNTVQSIFFLIFVGIMLVMVGQLFLPYASVLLWSSVIYILASPLYHKILSKMNPEKKFFNFKKRLLAGFFSVLTVAAVAGILLFVAIKVFGQGAAMIKGLNSFFEHLDKTASEEFRLTVAGRVKELSMGTIDISSWDLKKEAMGLIGKYSELIFKYTTGFAKNIGNFLMSLIFLAFSLYFFYLDGEYLLSILIHAIPIDTETSTQLFHKIKDITANLFKGLFLVSFYQGLFSFILYLLFGINNALLMAILTFFSSFLPLIGCGLIWFPLGIGLLITDSWLKACLFLLIAGGTISSMDNFLRPLFLKDRIKIHPLLIFFSMLGGVRLFAFDGIILGPMIVILFFTTIDIALELDESKSSLKTGGDSI